MLIYLYSFSVYERLEVVQLQINNVFPDDLQKDVDLLPHVFNTTPQAITNRAIDLLIKVRILSREAEFTQDLIDHQDAILTRLMAVPMLEADQGAVVRVDGHFPMNILTLSEYQASALTAIGLIEGKTLHEVLDDAMRLFVQRFQYDSPETYQALKAVADQKIRQSLADTMIACAKIRDDYKRNCTQAAQEVRERAKASRPVKR